MTIKKVIDFCLHFLLPNVCVICGKDTDDVYACVCRDCLTGIERIEGLSCAICSQPLPDGGAHCWQCKKASFHFEKIVAVGKYSGILRDLILKFKEMDCLKYSLGDLLLEIVEKNIGVQGFDLLVAVPLSKKREFSRGYNQSNLMAEVIGKKLNKPVVKNNLIRIRDTKPQFKLSRNERILNLKDAFRIKSPEAFKKKNIVIVDDVTTTCTTFEECARQLKNSGAGKIYCAALARD